MAISLGDELVVALAEKSKRVPGQPESVQEFSLANLAQLTGRSLKAVEESLYDLHRAGLLILKAEVRAGVVRIVGVELAPDGRMLSDRGLTAVHAVWESRAKATK